MFIFRNNFFIFMLAVLLLVNCTNFINKENSTQHDEKFTDSIVPLALGTTAIDPSRYGLCSHNAPNEILETFARIAIRWHRIDINWNELEPVQGQYIWGDLDRIVAKSEELGLSLLGCIAYTPTWASGSSDPAAPPRDPANFINFVHAVVKRYSTTFAALSIWNEPNLSQFWKGDKQTFINKIYLPAVQAIRSDAPGMTIAGPDTTGKSGRDNWMSPILDAAGSYLNIITHHQYDGNDTPSGRINEIKDLHNFLVNKGYGNRPLWITETGWDYPRFSRQVQADNLTAMMRGMQANSWWNKTFWYDSHGVGWGLVGTEGTPEFGKTYPAFYAYQNIIAGDLSAGPIGDAAKIVSDTIPTALNPGEIRTVSVTMANIGTLPWTRTEYYRLGAVGDNDPMGPGRIEIASGVTVRGNYFKPGTYTFTFQLKAPNAYTTCVTDWQMVKENVHWFGQILTKTVVIGTAPTAIPITPTPKPTAPPVTTSDRLTANQVLLRNQSITSTDGRFSVIYQGDGNLVLYMNRNTPLWASGTSGTTTGRTIMQGDGNLVIYNASSQPVWNTRTAGNTGAFVVIQNDGNLVVYTSAYKPLWASNTGGH